MSDSQLATAQSARPNVLLIMTDDQGFGDIASHGNPYVQTPNQDLLATQGARFERFFVSPVCAPTRASLLTGRYHLRTGVSGVTRGYENMRDAEITIAEVLQTSGYRTGCFGKWHNGRHMPQHPNGQGFETFLGFCGGHWNTYFDPPLEHNGTPVERNGFIADVITSEANKFITQHAASSWFCYVALNTPHSPWRVPDEYWARFNGLGLDTKAQCAYAMVENIDDNLGRLLKTLDDTNQAKNTIVLFLTDNGANSDRFNAGMKGRKGSVDEGGTRVPLFVRYPQVIRTKTVIQPIAFHLDILPTLADLCSVELSPAHQASLDGRSLVPLLTDAANPEDWPDRMLFTDTFRIDRGEKFMKGAVRTDRWRATMAGRKWKLFNMIADPGQETDVSSDHPAVTQKLAEEFQKWFESIDTENRDSRRIRIGHPTRKQFQIPANEADLTPGYGDQIRYTGDTESGYANSWITGWTSTEAYPSWPLKVLQDGKYDLSIQYGCDARNVGCQLEITIGNASRIVNIPQAAPGELIPKPDRLYSNNYQSRSNWQTLDVGSFGLTQGDADLTIKLKSLTGDAGIELHSVVLRTTLEK